MIQQPSILLKLNKYSKTKTHPLTFHKELLIIQNTYPEHLQIYSDGSKDGNQVGNNSQKGLLCTAQNYLPLT